MTDGDFDEEATADREAVRAALMSSRKRSPRKKRDDDKPDEGSGLPRADEGQT